MNNLIGNIYQAVSSGDNVLLVGSTDSGKTWYIKNTLMPFLRAKRLRVIYFSDSDFMSESNDKADVFIVDEIETLFDRNFLETHSTDSEPYYSEEYLVKVKIWHDKLRKLTAPSIFILTRNNQEEIDNIVNKLKVTDWGAKVKCLAFTKRTISNKDPLIHPNLLT